MTFQGHNLKEPLNANQIINFKRMPFPETLPLVNSDNTSTEIFEKFGMKECSHFLLQDTSTELAFYIDPFIQTRRCGCGETKANHTTPAGEDQA